MNIIKTECLQVKLKFHTEVWGLSSPAALCFLLVSATESASTDWQRWGILSFLEKFLGKNSSLAPGTKRWKHTMFLVPFVQMCIRTVCLFRFKIHHEPLDRFLLNNFKSTKIAPTLVLLSYEWWYVRLIPNTSSELTDSTRYLRFSLQLFWVHLSSKYPTNHSTDFNKTFQRRINGFNQVLTTTANWIYSIKKWLESHKVTIKVKNVVW